MPSLIAARKPTVGTYVEWARAGLLLTYASDPQEGYRRAGVYAARIFNGERPGDLPIEQPTKFTLALNTKTAAQLGLVIPLILQASVDEVIE